MRKYLGIFIIILTIGNYSHLLAEVIMPNLFSDNMVLQQKRPIPIWGWAKPGEKITISFKNNKISTITTKDGTWKIIFPPMKADRTPASMEIVAESGRKKIVNILIGEVWLCSGQSNMEFNLRALKNASKTIENAKYPLLRTCNIAYSLAEYPAKTVTGDWVQCSPGTAPAFSAVGFYFARELMHKLEVPIGIINSSVGCTSIEAWTSENGFRMVPSLKAHVEKIENANTKYEASLKKYLPKLKAWLKTVEKGEKVPLPYGFPKHPLAAGRDTGCFRGMETGHFNAMISPLIPYAIRGVIWYQGETNQADGISYAKKMEALVGGWREAWGYDFPFYFVQIPPYPYQNSNLTNFWIGQYIAANDIKNSNMICTVDVADLKNPHPQQKEPVGRRLAMLALKYTYGLTNLSAKSPYFYGLKIEGTKARISFRNVSEDGLTSADGKPLNWIEIAGKDARFYKAKAIIDGKNIIVSSGKVKLPVIVRFAWSDVAQPNLCDKKTSLPVFPFHSQLFYQYNLCRQNNDK